MKKLVLTMLCLIPILALSQTGVIKGKVTDKHSESQILGAYVFIVGAENISTTTDVDGNFKLTNVPLGRQDIEIRNFGYENAFISEIDVIVGRDNIIDISMSEQFITLTDVVVTSTIQNKAKAINKMAVVSVRQFSSEEANRYAGGRSDVARLASNFAGVAAANDSRNDIVIRGNSPAGLLWRLEGIPVPSPNHFATLGTTGSPVSALNPNMLSNSDFITSAFPAEYGNAIGGVFDLGFRKGNTENYEYTVGVSAFPGIETLAEGPMLKKKGGSFVAAARYGIINFLGLAGTTASPNYNDLSFKLDFGKSKLGNFSVFGIAGNSDIDFIGIDIENEDDLFAAKDQDAYAKSNFSAFGLKHIININDKSYLKTTVGSSLSKNTYQEFRYYNFETPEETRLQNTDVDNTEKRLTFSTLFNSKISTKFTVASGLLYENFNLNANTTDRDGQEDNNGDGYPDFVSVIKNNDSYSIFQPYIQSQIRLSEKLTLNAGVHFQYFSINEQFVVEPRTSLSFALNSKSAINLGYGMHHQNVAAPILFLNENIGSNLIQSNKNLDLVRSNHYVIGYDLRFADKWRAKVELYHQSINKAAVERIPSGYSSLTEGASFSYSTDKNSLISEGKGTNTGVELTLEKFFSKGYNFLFTSSFFESKYEGSDGIERNSPFNNKYVINILGGKEFIIGKEKKNVFSINTKFTTAGGRYYTPVNLVASQAAGYEVLDESKPFSQQYDSYSRLDLKFGMKLNSKTKKHSHQFYVDFQNITNKKNVFTKEYNRLTGVVNQKNQIGFQPDFGYRFNF